MLNIEMKFYNCSKWMKVPSPKDAEGTLLRRVCRLQSWWKGTVKLVVRTSFDTRRKSSRVRKGTIEMCG